MLFIGVLLYLTIDKAPINPSDKYRLVAIVWVMSNIAAGIIELQKAILLFKNGYFVECATENQHTKTIAVMTFGSVGSLIMLSSAKKSVVNNFQNLISCVKTQN